MGSTGRAEILEKLREVSRAVKTEFSKSAPAPVLYHYTDAVGLKGILETRSLWMKSDDETKDPLELQYANVVFQKVADELAWSLTKISAINPYLPDPQFHNIPSTYGIYFSSFCRSGDVPHHWQNFANGGRGFSIGFHNQDGPVGWTTLAKDASDKLLLEPVIYEPGAQEHLLRSILQASLRFFKSKDALEVAGALRQVMGEVLPFFKDRSFREEQEWRFVGTRLSNHTPDDAQVDVRDGRLGAVLKLRRTQGNLPIASIGIGPRMPRGTEGHLHALLHQNGYGHVPIEPSRWQLRP